MPTMSPLDASFLHVEDAVTHVHIGSVGILEGPVTTNVPGPQQPLYLAGRRMLEASPSYRWADTCEPEWRSSPTTAGSTSGSPAISIRRRTSAWCARASKPASSSCSTPPRRRANQTAPAPPGVGDRRAGRPRRAPRSGGDGRPRRNGGDGRPLRNGGDRRPRRNGGGDRRGETAGGPPRRADRATLRARWCNGLDRRTLRPSGINEPDIAPPAPSMDGRQAVAAPLARGADARDARRRRPHDLAPGEL